MLMQMIFYNGQHEVGTWSDYIIKAVYHNGTWSKLGQNKVFSYI